MRDAASLSASPKVPHRMAIMMHYSPPIELFPPALRYAILGVRSENVEPLPAFAFVVLFLIVVIVCPWLRRRMQ
jgi:hypothetical protein